MVLEHSSEVNSSNFVSIHLKRSKQSLKKQHELLSGIKIKDTWNWDPESRSKCISLSNQNRVAYFFDNPFTISRGTVGVRGNKELLGVCYFEVLVKEPLYGTAVMIGIGNESVKLHYGNFDFVNLVGNDSNSWGLCHKGTIWHNNQYTRYCEPFFDKNTIIGVLYNSYNRTLHYFLNHKYLGVAFRNINPDNRRIYPIIASTATDIELELIDSFKIIYSLKSLCFEALTRRFKNEKNISSTDLDQLPIAKSLIYDLKDYKAYV